MTFDYEAKIKEGLQAVEWQVKDRGKDILKTAIELKRQADAVETMARAIVNDDPMSTYAMRAAAGYITQINEQFSDLMALIGQQKLLQGLLNTPLRPSTSGPQPNSKGGK